MLLWVIGLTHPAHTAQATLTFVNNNNAPVLSYPEQATLILLASDSDLNQNNQLAESVTAVVSNNDNGDLEIIILKETGLATGTFRGSLATTTVGVVTAGNGILRANTNNQIEATFYDVTDMNQPPTTALTFIRILTKASIALVDASNNVMTTTLIDSTLHIRLIDANNNLDPAVQDTIVATATTLVNTTYQNDNSQSETEHLTLTETSINSGVFQGVIASQNQLEVASDQVLAARCGDIVTVTYQDPLDPSDMTSARLSFITSPTPAQLRILDGLTNQEIPLADVQPDQSLIVEVSDNNRNCRSTQAERIISAESLTATTLAQAISAPAVVIESLDAQGNHLDWLPLTLEEAGNNTGIFRARIQLASQFGQNQGLIANSVLYSQVSGRIGIFYRDDVGLVNGLPEKLSIQYSVEPPPLTLTFTDGFGHSTAQLYLRDPFSFFGVDIVAPAAAPNGALRDVLPANMGHIENITRGDRFALPATLETSNTSNTFSYQFLSKIDGQPFIFDQNLEGLFGDVIHLRFYDVMQPNNPLLWSYTTAVLCRNANAFIDVVDTTEKKQSEILTSNIQKLVLFDPDQNTNNQSQDQVQVILNTAVLQDQEILVLTETTLSSGIFSAQLPAQDATTAQTNDGQLSLAKDDQVTIGYQDSSNANEDSPLCQAQNTIEASYPAGNGQRNDALNFVDANGKTLTTLNIAQPVRIRLRAPQLNKNTQAVDTASVDFFADPNRQFQATTANNIINATLYETQPSSGVFIGQVDTQTLGLPLAPATTTPTLGQWYTAIFKDPNIPDKPLIASAPLLAQPLYVSMQAKPEQASIGDMIDIVVDIYNPNPVATQTATLVIETFPDLAAVKNSLTLNGTPIGLPKNSGPWRIALGSIAANGKAHLRWQAGVSPRQTKTIQTSSAQVWFADIRASNRAEAQVKIVDEPIFSLATIAISVFEDLNNNGLFDKNEPPLEHARVISADGISVWTDAQGKGHFANIKAGYLGFRLDPKSLPHHLEPDQDGVHYLEILPGMLHTLNFPTKTRTNKTYPFMFTASTFPGQTTTLTMDLPVTDATLHAGPLIIKGQISPAIQLYLNGHPVTTDTSGRFVYETQIAAKKNYTLAIRAQSGEQILYQHSQTWPVKRSSILSVGLVEVSSNIKRRNNHKRGGIDTLWDIRGEGRFYVEGALPGNVLLKARLTTTNEPLQDFLPRLLDYNGDAEDLIDPNKTYPVYGDQSTSTTEAPGEGPLYLFVGWRGQIIEIGTIGIDLRDSLLDNLVQTNYGAHLHLSTEPFAKTTTFPTTLDLLATRPNTAFSQERFALTGGLVYRLKYRDIQAGSVEVSLEERDLITGSRLSQQTLQLGRDYTIDYQAGRLWLTTPIALTGTPQNIIRDQTFTGSPRELVISYRYHPTNLASGWGHSEILEQALGKYGHVGLMYQEDRQATKPEQRGRTWLELTPVKDTTVRFEYGRRWGPQSASFFSEDGGLTFDQVTYTSDKPANAFAATIDSKIKTVQIEGYARHFEAGFGSLRYSDDVTLTAAGIGLAWSPITDVTIGLRGDLSYLGATDFYKEHLYGQVPLGPLILTTEGRLQQNRGLQNQTERADLGIGLQYPLPPHWLLYGQHQQQVYGPKIASGGEKFDRRTLLGTQYQFSSTWSAFIEGAAGNRDRGARIGGRYRSDKNTQQTSAFSYGVEQDITNQALRGIVGLGGSQPLGKRAIVSSSQEFRHGNREVGVASLAGIEIAAHRYLRIGTGGEWGNFEKLSNTTPLTIERRAAYGSLQSVIHGHEISARGGWHQSQDPDQTLTGRTASASWRSSWNDGDGQTLLQYRYSADVSSDNSQTIARYHEYTLGAAYRPTRFDRLALLAMVRFAKELLPNEQDPSRTEILALISSLDFAIRIIKPIEVGGKLAFKRAGASGGGFSNAPIHTLLSALRFAWIFYKGFDLWAEYRLWQQWETNQLLHGPMIEIGVRPAKFMRFAIGYNFSHFGDELRPHDRFNEHGLRFRLQGLF